MKATRANPFDSHEVLLAQLSTEVALPRAAIEALPGKTRTPVLAQQSADADEPLTLKVQIRVLRTGGASLGGGLPPARIRRVAEFIRVHLAERFSISDLARTVGLSRFHFARAFRASTGETPAAFVSRLRIERACVLLAEPSASVVDVAGAVGFESASHFAKVFQRCMGLSPSAYRRLGTERATSCSFEGPRSEVELISDPLRHALDQALAVFLGTEPLDRPA